MLIRSGNGSACVGRGMEAAAFRSMGRAAAAVETATVEARFRGLAAAVP